MSYTDSYLAERLMDLRVQEEQRQAELRRLRREARRDHRSWLTHQSHWLLCRLGSLFVSLAVRFLHGGLQQPRPAEE